MKSQSYAINSKYMKVATVPLYRHGGRDCAVVCTLYCDILWHYQKITA